MTVRRNDIVANEGADLSVEGHMGNPSALRRTGGVRAPAQAEEFRMPATRGPSPMGMVT